MPRPACLILAPLVALSLSGCLAKAALDVATAPVKLAGKAVDVATTSQSESDERRGRELRQREERYGKLDRQYRKALDRCGDGNDRACEEAGAISREMDEIRATIPAAPERR